MYRCAATILAIIAAFIAFIQFPAPAFSRSPTVDISRVEATSTEKGDIRSIFAKKGLWQGKREPNPYSAQRLSDKITIQFGGPGAHLRGLIITPCDRHRFESKIFVTAVLSDNLTSVKAKGFDCKKAECFAFPVNELPIKGMIVDFLENRRACVKRVSFQLLHL